MVRMRRAQWRRGVRWTAKARQWNNKEQRENRHRIEELVRVAWLFVYVIAAIITYHAYPFISLRSRFKHDYRRDYHDRRDDNYKN